MMRPADPFVHISYAVCVLQNPEIDDLSDRYRLVTNIVESLALVPCLQRASERKRDQEKENATRHERQYIDRSTCLYGLADLAVELGSAGYV